MRVRQLVPIAALATCLLMAVAFAEDLRIHVVQGMDLNPEDVAYLEEKVGTDPNDLVSRAQVLGYYFMQEYRCDSSTREKRGQHILWVIRNVPEAAILEGAEGQLDQDEDPEGYAAAREAWHDQIARNPGNTTLLYHAARAFVQSELKLAIDFLQ